MCVQQKAKDHFGIEGDEESTMYEDSVSPAKYVFLQLLLFSVVFFWKQQLAWHADSVETADIADLMVVCFISEVILGYLFIQ